VGDRFAAAGPFAQLQDRFEAAFAAHVEAERALVGRLQGPLTPAEHGALGSRLDRALRHAPTRPHPYGPHTSRLTPLAFRLRALADHTLDVMDNRRGADHPPPAPVRPGKWGPTCSAWYRPRRPRDRRRSGRSRVAGRRDDGSDRHHLAVGFEGFPERALTCSPGPGRRPHQGPRTTNNRWCRPAARGPAVGETEVPRRLPPVVRRADGLG
jgi:hypothetical protein